MSFRVIIRIPKIPYPMQPSILQFQNGFDHGNPFYFLKMMAHTFECLAGGRIKGAALRHNVIG